MIRSPRRLVATWQIRMLGFSMLMILSLFDLTFTFKVAATGEVPRGVSVWSLDIIPQPIHMALVGIGVVLMLATHNRQTLARKKARLIASAGSGFALLMIVSATVIGIVQAEPYPVELVESIVGFYAGFFGSMIFAQMRRKSVESASLAATVDAYNKGCVDTLNSVRDGGRGR